MHRSDQTDPVFHAFDKKKLFPSVHHPLSNSEDKKGALGPVVVRLLAVREPICSDNGAAEVGPHSSFSALSPSLVLNRAGYRYTAVRASDINVIRQVCDKAHVQAVFN